MDELKEKTDELLRKNEEIKKFEQKCNETGNRLGEVETQLGVAHEKGVRLDKEKKKVEGELSESRQELDGEKRAKQELDRNLRKRVCLLIKICIKIIIFFARSD